MARHEGAPALFLDNVVKTYGAIRAVDGVGFTASAGEFIALLGPNGAGKSTLFQLLSGLFVPDSGRIEIMGHDMLRDPVPALAMLGMSIGPSRAPVGPLSPEKQQKMRGALQLGGLIK